MRADRSVKEVVFMGRRVKEVEEVEESDAEVLSQLHSVEGAFAEVGYPNRAMQALAELAMLEYRKADRAIDRSKWFSSLLQVAKVCGNLGEEELEERAGSVQQEERLPAGKQEQMLYELDFTGFDDEE